MKEFLNHVLDIVKQGLPVPQAYDTQAKEISFRLWAANLSFHLSVGSIIALHFWDVSTATFTSIGFFALCMVFYTLKKLSRAKIDLKSGSIDLEDEKPS